MLWAFGTGDSCLAPGGGDPTCAKADEMGDTRAKGVDVYPYLIEVVAGKLEGRSEGPEHVRRCRVRTWQANGGGDTEEFTNGFGSGAGNTGVRDESSKCLECSATAHECDSPEMLVTGPNVWHQRRA